MEVSRERRGNRVHARLRGKVTSADLSPDAQTLAVMTYDDLMLYRRNGSRDSWAKVTKRAPTVHALPWIPQAEAVAWSAGGRGLFATGEFSPAPLFYLVP